MALAVSIVSAIVTVRGYRFTHRPDLAVITLERSGNYLTVPLAVRNDDARTFRRVKVELTRPEPQDDPGPGFGLAPPVAPSATTSGTLLSGRTVERPVPLAVIKVGATVKLRLTVTSRLGSRWHLMQDLDMPGPTVW